MQLLFDFDLLTSLSQLPAGNHASANLHPKTGHITKIWGGYLKVFEDPNINHLIHIAKDRTG